MNEWEIKLYEDKERLGPDDYWWNEFRETEELREKLEIADSIHHRTPHCRETRLEFGSTFVLTHRQLICRYD